MKKLLFLILFLPFVGLAQSPMSTDNTNNIKLQSTSQLRSYNMFQEIIDRLDVQTASGTNTYVISGTLGITSYSGLSMRVLFTNGNTASSTLNVNSLGAKTLKNKATGANLVSGDLFAGGTYTVSYDGTNIQVDLGGSGGAGTVSTVSVVSTNGLAGTVANPTTTPAITLSTTLTGLVKGNGTAFSAASAGTDYEAPGLDWRLASGGTLTGVNTITSNAKNQLNFTGTWTATAAANAHMTFGGTFTAASGLGVTGYLINPTLNAVGTSPIQVALDVKPTFSGGTAPVNIAARFNDGLVVYNQSNSTATNRGFSLSSRDALVNFPVPSLRPTTLDKVMALDIMPNGSPTENAGNGFAWFDVVDVDALTSEPPLRTARVGIKSTGAEFGSYSFNAGVQLPMIFTMSGTVFMSGTTSGRILIGTHTSPVITEQLSIKKDQNGGTYEAIINGTSGTGAFAGLIVGASSTLTTRVALYSFSPAWTTSGMEVASTAALESTDANGLSAGTSVATPFMVWTNNVERARFLSTGEFLVGYTTSATGEVAGFRKDQNGGTVATLVNNTSGTGAYSQFIVSNSSSTTPGITLTALSAAWATSGIFVQNAGVVNSTKTAGLIIGSSISAPLIFYTNNTEKGRVLSTGEFGVNITAPLSTLDVSGSLGLKSNAISTDLTLDATYYEVLVDASGGNRVETLPAAASSIGRIYVIKKSDSSVNSITIDGNASETIDGALTKVVNTQYSGWQIHVNAAGTAWNITATF